MLPRRAAGAAKTHANDARQTTLRLSGRGNEAEKVLEKCSRGDLCRGFRAQAPRSVHIGPMLAKVAFVWNRVGKKRLRPEVATNTCPCQHLSSIFPASFPRPVRRRVLWRASFAQVFAAPAARRGSMCSACFVHLLQGRGSGGCCWSSATKAIGRGGRGRLLAASPTYLSPGTEPRVRKPKQ